MTGRVPWRALAKTLAVALAAFTASNAGCSNSQNALCPVGTNQAGIFTTSLAFNSADPNQCYYGDGGSSAPDASLSASSAAFTSAICSGFDVDGGSLVYLALPAFARVSALGAGGTFAFGTANLVSGTSCGCNIFVTETITGTLTPAAAGTSVTLNADGGLPALASFSGTVVDLLDGGDDAGVKCTCNLPCDLQYALSATAL